MAGDGFTVNPLGFFGEEFHEGGTIGNFTLGFGQWFALFGGQDCGEIVGVFDHQVEPDAQDIGAFLGGAGGPGLHRGIGGGDGAVGFGAAKVGDGGDHVATT
mgnify:CR=1 FL=1